MKSLDPKGVEYTGQISVTKAHPRFGIRKCRPWNEMTHRKMPNDGKNHNYCRNPDGVQSAPFCWVAKGQPGPKFGFCDIPDCVSKETLSRNNLKLNNYIYDFTIVFLNFGHSLK